MLTSKPTPEMIQEWKNLHEEYCKSLAPNRRTGKELKEYFCAKYQSEVLDLPVFIISKAKIWSRSHAFMMICLPFVVWMKRICRIIF